MKPKERRGLGWIILALVLLLVCGGIFWWRQTHTLTLEMYRTQIDQAISSTDYDLALSLCVQALEKYPESGDLYSQKARVYQLQGKIDLAVQTLDYGYKQTHLEPLLEQRDSYDETTEEDVQFHSVKVGSSSDVQQEEQIEEYVPYVLPQVSLPHVVPPTRPQEESSQSQEELSQSQEEPAQSQEEQPQAGSSDS